MTAGSMLDQALAYAAEGFRVFPLVPRGKVQLIAQADVGNGCLDATIDEATIHGEAQLNLVLREMRAPSVPYLAYLAEHHVTT